jgi:hypothetical protein
MSTDSPPTAYQRTACTTPGIASATGSEWKEASA